MAKKDKPVDVVYDLYKEQPEECRKPLAVKDIDPKTPMYIKRLLFYDPTPVYERIRYKLNVFTRYNFVPFPVMFPVPENGKCACGCGLDTKKGWASADCQRLAMAVWNVISCRQPSIIEFYLSYYYGKGDTICPICKEKPTKDIDHIIPCKDGAGGCWLTNYQIICEDCHAKKTAIENNWLKSKHLQNDGEGVSETAD